MATAVDSLEQNQNISTQRPECQAGFFIKKNPTSQIGTGYTYSDSAFKPTESTALRQSLWPRLFEIWHLLSLDAPTIAALWSWFFARAMRIDLPWHAPLLLAIGTWLIYVADRILDGIQTNPTTPLQQRHRFHARHRNAFLATAAAASFFLLWMIFDRMNTNARIEDTILFSAALLYFFLVHNPGANSRNWLPKELAVGVVFAAATAVPAWSRLGSGRTPLFPAVVIFATLCWLNCVAIEKWEGPSSKSWENLAPTEFLQSRNGHATTHWAAEHFRQTALGLATISGILAFVSFASNPGTLLLYLAATIAALSLIVIDLCREKLSLLHLRVAADAALLTPLILIPLLR